jgi:glyceraldehyde 3-phosphate dehydrogenase
MATKIGINGFGRIGRNVFRAILQRNPDLEVLAVNDLTDDKALAHLLKYDSFHGILDGDVKPGDGVIVVNGKSVRVLSERDPANLPWKDMGVEIVVESTGLFTIKNDGIIRKGKRFGERMDR